MIVRQSNALITAALLATVAACNGGSGTFAVPSIRVPTESGKTGSYGFTKYLIPTAKSYSNRIIAGPGGALWFTEEGYVASKIGSLTTQGMYTEYPLTVGTEPSHVASAYGNVWFSEKGTDGVGYVAYPSGQITYYTGALSTTRGIIQGTGSGEVWFTDFKAGDVAVIDANTGAITEYPVPTQAAQPYDITSSGPKAKTLWFSEFNASKIGSMTDRGVFKEYATPNNPQGLVFGPDGALWFTETSASTIGRMTTSGYVTEYATPTAKSDPVDITVGPDGALWFTEYSASKIGRITVDGQITETATPDAKAKPVGITTGPDGNIWFVEHKTNAIVKLTL